MHYPADVEAVGKLLEREFDVDWRNSARRGFSNVDPDRFGYRSDHYVVRISDARCQLVEWRQFEGYRAEIQVRTVMQHAWAAVDHKIQYKGSDLPTDMQRRLARLSALLEVADEQFASIQVQSDRIRASYEESVRRGELSIEINALSLGAFLWRANLADEWATRAVRAGFEPLQRYSAHNDHELPRLLRTLEATGIQRVKEFASALDAAQTWGDGVLSEIAREARATFGGAHHPDLAAAPISVLDILVLIFASDNAAIDASGFSPEMKRVIHSVSLEHVLIIGFGGGATALEGEEYYAWLRADAVVELKALRLSDVVNVQLRLSEARPSVTAQGVNRTIELEAALLEHSGETDAISAKLASDVLRWRARGPQIISTAYDVTASAKPDILEGRPLLRLRTAEAIEWTQVSLAIFRTGCSGHT